MLQHKWSLKNIMLSERYQSQKAMYCMIPLFKWNFQNRKIRRNKKVSEWLPVHGCREEQLVTADGNGFLLQGWKCSGISAELCEYT